jgi:hypothetical protein
MHVCVCMCMHVHVCACMCMYVHVCACMCMYVHVYACICMYMHVYACICMYMHVYACICMYMHVYACICMYVYVCACMWMSFYVCECLCTNVHVYATWVYAPIFISVSDYYSLLDWTRHGRQLLFSYLFGIYAPFRLSRALPTPLSISLWTQVYFVNHLTTPTSSRNRLPLDEI